MVIVAHVGERFTGGVSDGDFPNVPQVLNIPRIQIPVDRIENAIHEVNHSYSAKKSYY